MYWNKYMAKAKERKQSVQLAKTFVPRFWENDIDGRLATVREIRRRYMLLKKDAAVDSYQKDILCQRCIFLALQLESSEVLATEGGPWEPAVYCQQINTMLGLLKALGLGPA